MASKICDSTANRLASLATLSAFRIKWIHDNMLPIAIALMAKVDMNGSSIGGTIRSEL